MSPAFYPKWVSSKCDWLSHVCGASKTSISSHVSPSPLEKGEKTGSLNDDMTQKPFFVWQKDFVATKVEQLEFISLQINNTADT